MENTFKTGDSVAIYFGDTMRELLSKPLRKKGVYFVDCKIVAIDGDTLTVLSQMRNAKDKLPYKVMGLTRTSSRNSLPATATMRKNLKQHSSLTAKTARRIKSAGFSILLKKTV